MTQRIEPLFFNNDSESWTLCKWLIELSLFYEPLLNKSWIFLFLTQRIEPIFWMWLFQKTQKIELFSKKNDSKNWTFLNMTQWIEPSFNDSKNWTSLSHELFLNDSKNLTFFFQYDSKNWTLFRKNDSKNWTFFEYDSKNWISFWVWLKDSTFFLVRLNESNPFFDVTQKLKFLVEKVKDETFQFFENSKLIFSHDSKNWTRLFNMTQRIELFFFIWLEVFFSGLEESNHFFQYGSTNRTLF